MADEKIVEACDRYLARLGCVLWGRAFDVVHPDGRAEAAEWLAQQVEAVNAEAHNPAHWPVSNGKAQ